MKFCSFIKYRLIKNICILVILISIPQIFFLFNNEFDSSYSVYIFLRYLNIFSFCFEIFKNFPLATILRPSIVYSVEDQFTTSFMSLLSKLPFFPLYYGGSTRFAPIHVSDLTDTISYIISNNIYYFLYIYLYLKYFVLQFLVLIQN